jgi:fructose/tagatose bisphosphate aldolase
MVVFESLGEMLESISALGRIEGRRFVANGTRPDGPLVDRLARTAAFGPSPELKGSARWIVRSVAAALGVKPASIHELYMALGRGEAAGFTVPAMNLRVLTYDSARAAFRAARAVDAGALVFEIARSEIGYTGQRPHEYAAMITAAALRERFVGPVFIQGDHVQVNAGKYRGPGREQELEALRSLIVEEIAAGFYNVDVDSSTLVDLDRPTLDEQQETNCRLCAELTAFCRESQPKGVTISVGGEIGEVGGRNSDVHELHAFMRGYQAALLRRGSLPGLSKISVQTGTEHGGVVGPDGTVRMDVQIDVAALEELSRVARTEYGMGGAVQHGASTLPPDAFDAFPKAGACEIHLATDFQNIVVDHPLFPTGLRDEMNAWLREHAAGERRPSDTDAQFLFRTRKKSVGAFKRELWSLDDDVKDAIGRSLEERFSFLFTKLNVAETTSLVRRFVTVPAPVFDREVETLAAAGQITVAERKADGLSD